MLLSVLLSDQKGASPHVLPLVIPGCAVLMPLTLISSHHLPFSVVTSGAIVVFLRDRLDAPLKSLLALLHVLGGVGLEGTIS